MTHLTHISEGNRYLTVSPPSARPRRHFSGKLRWAAAERRAASRTAEIVSRCSMTHLAQTFPALTDLNEPAAEEALEREEINGDQMTHNPPAISGGEPETPRLDHD